MYIVLTLCLLLVVYGLYFWHRRNAYGHKLPPAMPGAWPIIGHNHIIYKYKNDIIAFLKDAQDFCAKSDGIITIYFENEIYYAVTDLEDAATIAKACSQKHHLFKIGEALLGNGLITASGPIYYSHRKLLNPAFSLSVIYQFLDVFNEQSRQLTNIFDGFVGKGQVDTRESLKNVSLRTTCITVFGSHKKDNNFIKTYTSTIDAILETFLERALTIWLHNEFFFKLSSLKTKQDKLINLINDNIQEIINRKRDEMKYKAKVDHLSISDKGFRSFIDILLEIAADGSLSDQEIKDELNTIAVASYETTSRQLVYIMILLGTYPDIQEKVFQEVMTVVGDRDLQKDDILKLVYTEAFLKECMRIATVVSILPKYLERDVKVRNYTLPAGAHILLLNDGIHRQPIWGPDANEFRPERWLDKEKQLDNLPFYFGHGQRVCVGKKYATVSMKVTLAHIVRKFQIKADFNKTKSKFIVLIEPECGHEITVERRNK